MTEYKQTRFGVKSNNAFQTAVACLLDRPVSDVPDLGHGDDWLNRLRPWLLQQGLDCSAVRYSDDLEEFLVRAELHYLVVGTAPYGPGYHCVIGHHGALEYDPHPKREFLDGEPTDFVFLLPARRITSTNIILD